MKIYNGNSYNPVGAESISTHYLRSPIGYLVVIGTGHAQLVPKNDIAYSFWEGADLKTMVTIWGPPEIIQRLRDRQCEMSVLPYKSSSGATTTESAESNQ